jgi:hypothetical protein
MPHTISEISLMGLGDWLNEPRHNKFSGFSIYTQTAYLRQKEPAEGSIEDVGVPEAERAES